MSISGIGSGVSPVSGLFGTSATGGSNPADPRDPETARADDTAKSATDEFLDYARMSVAERIRAAILEQKGLDEKKLAALDAETRKKVEEEIRETIEEKMKAETGGATSGTMVNLTA